MKENIEYELRYREQHYKNRKQFDGELDSEERARDSRNAKRRYARYGSDSRKGLGYNGRSFAVSGGISAGGVRADGTAAYHIKDGSDDEGVVENTTRSIRGGAEGDDIQAEQSADGGREHSVADDEPRTTGWESSRNSYERYLGTGQGTGEGYLQHADEYRSPYMDHPHGDIGRSIGVGGSIVNSALRSLAGVTDGSEDPEERIKRIEAEQSASNFGAVIGLVAGIISSAMDTESDDLLEELEKEQNEMRMNF